jgi:hypothetical protein
MSEKKEGSGTAKLGPSRAYLRLLEGRTSSEEYTRVLKRTVDIRRPNDTSRTASA